MNHQINIKIQDHNNNRNQRKDKSRMSKVNGKIKIMSKINKKGHNKSLKGPIISMSIKIIVKTMMKVKASNKVIARTNINMDNN